MIKSDKCLNPHCRNFQHARGLCSSCYRIARNMVTVGITTWERMISEGKAVKGRTWTTKTRNMEPKTIEWIKS